MDKHVLIDQMKAELRQIARQASVSSQEAAQEARLGATPGEKAHDSRIALEYSQMAKAQSRRANAAREQLDTLDRFHPTPLARRAPIKVGAIVEVEDEDTGEGRTFFLAPVGAGISLTGPGGDGLLTVVTPASPIGKAVTGRRVGEVIDVTVKRDPREWLITYVG